jgi:hypothetical protein
MGTGNAITRDEPSWQIAVALPWLAGFFFLAQRAFDNEISFEILPRHIILIIPAPKLSSLVSATPLPQLGVVDVLRSTERRCGLCSTF